MYALFKGDKQVSKPHSTRWAVAMEAYEQKAVLTAGAADFPGDTGYTGPALAAGYSIQAVKEMAE